MLDANDPVTLLPPPVPPPARGVARTLLRRLTKVLLFLVVLPVGCVSLYGRFNAGSVAHGKVHPGMSVSEVLEATSGWFLGSGTNDHGVTVQFERPRDDRPGVVHVTTEDPKSSNRPEIELLTAQGWSELGQALASRMKAAGSPWKLHFLYLLRPLPLKGNFDVKFDLEGRVTMVSPFETWD